MVDHAQSPWLLDSQVREEVQRLKQFLPAVKRHWHDVPETLWQDWRWQLRNRIRTPEQLIRVGVQLTREELEGFSHATNRLRFSITPYFSCLIDPLDQQCPIRRQVIPHQHESLHLPEEMLDPCGEDETSPVPGLVHRYPDRVLLLAGTLCACYCRYCTRSRLVGRRSLAIDRFTFERQLDYIRSKNTIRDVLISGGDPLLFSDQRLREILNGLRAIPHVEIIRIGTRVPIFLPQRITDDLCELLRSYHPLFVSVHVNHPAELTVESKIALTKLADAGIPLGSQTVLLRGINDQPTVLLALVQKLLMCRVKPYYLYQCDPVIGTAHFRVPIQKGIELLGFLQGHTSGYAVPHYVVDAPGGGGKIPIAPNCLLDITKTHALLKNYEGKIYRYPISPACTLITANTHPSD